MLKHAAYVLSISTETRNKFLIRDLRLHMKAKIVLGEKGELFEVNIHGNEKEISQILSNRNLTRNEIACTDGHRRMIREAVKDNVDVAFFLEDDAVIPQNFSLLLQEMDLFEGIPALCLVAYERERILCRKIRHGKLREFYKCYSLPTCAQFYTLNRAALLLLDAFWQRRQYSEVADFPTWYWDQVEFFLSPSKFAAPVVRHDSTIGFARFEKNNSHFIKRIKKYSCMFWLFKLKEFMSLRAYLAVVHARLIQKMFHFWLK